MLLHYTAKGTETESWSWSPNSIMNDEAELIEKVTGMTFAEWADAVERGSMTALHALLWVLRKRRETALTHKGCSFTLDEVELEMERQDKVDSLARLRETLETGVLSPEDRETSLRVCEALEAEIAAEDAKTTPAEEATVDGPKEPPEQPSETSGGLHSLPSGAFTPESSSA